jgi:hypothetical protein
MTDHLSPPLIAAALAVLTTLDAAHVPVCLIGGMVIARWGQPRATTDVDCSVLAPYGDEQRIVDTLLAHFRPRRPDARAFALDRRVLLQETEEGVKIDVALAAFPFEIEAIEHATAWTIAPGMVVRTCSAKHLVVYKLVAARPQDLLDVDSIVRRQGRRLDVDCIRRWGHQSPN